MGPTRPEHPSRPEKSGSRRPSWTRHLIDDGNAIGTQFVVADLNGDGLLDVIVSNKKGVACIEQLKD